MSKLSGVKFVAMLAAVVSAVALTAADVVWSLDLDDPAVKARVAQCPYAKIAKDYEGTNVLTVSIPPGEDQSSFKGSVTIPLDIAAMKLDGVGIYSSGDIECTNVTPPKNPWNGIKFMVTFTSNGKEDYPDLNPGWQRNMGTRKWYTATSNLPIPADVKKGNLVLGLQQSTGTVSFRNIKFFKANASPVSTLKQTPIPQAKYTMDPTVRRGVMSPNSFKEEDFAEMEKWNVGLVRWQLNRSLGREYTLDEYKAETAKNIDNLATVLDSAARHRISVVIDLHPFEGGKLVLGSAAGQQYLIDVWQEIAKRYGKHPAVWGYDILNEPHSRNLKPGDPSWPELAQRTIKAIRAVDPKTPIIIESDRMANYDDLEFLPVFDEPNIIYSIHFYTPGQLTHQLRPDQKPFQGYPDESKGYNKEYLRKELARAREFQQKTGARIYVGEFGCVRWAPGAADYLKDLIDIFEEYQWDWSYHAFREWPGWSVEYSDDPEVNTPVPNTKRKEVLLEGLKKNVK